MIWTFGGKIVEEIPTSTSPIEVDGQFVAYGYKKKKELINQSNVEVIGKSLMQNHKTLEKHAKQSKPQKCPQNLSSLTMQYPFSYHMVLSSCPKFIRVQVDTNATKLGNFGKFQKKWHNQKVATTFPHKIGPYERA